MDTVRTNSICQNCRHQSKCHYQSYSKTSIHFCEEYDPCEEAEVDRIPKFFADLMKKESEETKAGKAPFGTARGLCINCENQGFCGMEKPEAGIWHCEEYR
ncbi:MAG: hypothetical protein HQK54_07205 [Oligoflexales bacterium]|nr:hypothetical protein [Oligoflexales bacterium]